MIISIIYLVISFLLEGIMSNIFPSTLSNISYFTTIYIIIAFTILIMIRSFLYLYLYLVYYLIFFILQQYLLILLYLLSLG